MITKRQRDVMLFVQRFQAEHGYGPSFAEIAVGIGVNSHGMVQRLVAALKERGYISFLPCRARAITILKRVEERVQFFTYDNKAEAIELYRPANVEAAE